MRSCKSKRDIAVVQIETRHCRTNTRSWNTVVGCANRNVRITENKRLVVPFGARSAQQPSYGLKVNPKVKPHVHSSVSRRGQNRFACSLFAAEAESRRSCHLSPSAFESFPHYCTLALMKPTPTASRSNKKELMKIKETHPTTAGKRGY